ncbi:hypothetical protein YA0850_01180 [Pseudomonas veronii]|uniref:Uncharacterized protein n=1 Tax=Pseudomonas veronii TaxID=76761 RepID=A0ABS0VCB2_PSEVE|nr:hypothetical protein [Pseudomonas veronii]MBI6551037.1 hypothetical protein [Pseudomonas veronii]MBI6649135.1 hypothetical protein [Pseudomonas veronii]
MPDPVHDSITTVTAKVTPVVATGVLAFAPRFEVFSSVTLLPILVGYSSAVNYAKLIDPGAVALYIQCVVDVSS